MYTAESLTGLTLKAKLVPLQDATAVLSMVALGHADFGIVYRSDAKDDPQVQQVCAVPRERHRPVVYVAVLPPNPPAESQRLVDSLLQGKGREILTRHGLLPPPSQ
jgi:ABC-type molybdate transport system substrate-binding protein